MPLRSRPPRLTFPAREPGARKIMAGKLQVGICVGLPSRGRWEAWLWAAAGVPDTGRAGIIRGFDLRNLRDAVAGRLNAEGPWWSETGGTG